MIKGNRSDEDARKEERYDCVWLGDLADRTNGYGRKLYI